jgi:hypothetical protein
LGISVETTQRQRKAIRAALRELEQQERMVLRRAPSIGELAPNQKTQMAMIHRAVEMLTHWLMSSNRAELVYFH